MELSNALIYGNKLVCGSPEIGIAKLRYMCSLSAPVWLMKVLDPNQPVIFINTDLLPAYKRNDRKAVNNPIKANIIAELSILEECGLIQRALEELRNKESKIIDKLSSKEQEVSLFYAESF